MAFRSFIPLSRALPFLLIGTSLEAALIRPLDDLKVIEVPISRESLTRISVKDDRILHVFGVADEYVLEADEDQGQIFVHPNSLESSTKSISLTLTTEGGHTQDLRLMPRDQAPEALILIKPGEDKDDSLKTQTAPTPITRDEVETLLQASLEGRIPLGYKPCPRAIDPRIIPVPINQASATENPRKFPDSSPLTVKISPLKATLVRELKGDPQQGKFLRALTYEIRNTTNAPLTLSEAVFAKQFREEVFPVSYRRKLPGEITHPIIAILISQKNLNPGEGGYVHVVVQSPY